MSSPKEVTYDIGPITGIARNKTLARKDAEEKAAKAMHGVGCPYFMYWKGAVVVVWKSLEWWSYRIIWPDDIPKLTTERSYCTTGGTDSRENTILDARYNVAQAQWDVDDGPSLDEETKKFLVSDEKIDEMEHWVRWQWKYKQAIHNGLPDYWARLWANTERNYKTLDAFMILHKEAMTNGT